LEEKNTKYQKEIREQLIQKLIEQKVEDPEQVLVSIETYCDIILRSIMKENG
jgi:hypothetical protein